MKILVDTNVFLDVVTQREPFSGDSERFLLESKREGVGLFSTWHTVSNVWYIIRKESGEKVARDVVSSILKNVEIPRCGSLELFRATTLKMRDFEDAMQAAVAESCEIDFIATRNWKDFADSPVEAKTPAELLAIFSAKSEPGEG